MKKHNFHFIFLGLIGLISLFSSCHKPFEGVSAIVSNSFIKQRIGVQVIDANPKATNPYPKDPSITLSGDAVKKGLIYTGDGEALTETPGNAKLVNNAITLAIKPNTIISASSPLKFTIQASAAGYLTNAQDVVVRSADSLQYVKVRLLKPSDLPAGVANVAVQDNSVVNGVSSTNFVVNVAPPGNASQPQVNVTFPAGTLFKDNLGAAISKSSLAVNVTNFSSTSPDAGSAITGGLNNITTSASSTPQSFILAAAVDFNVNLGGVAVKTFSQPIPVELFVSDKTYNPVTKALLKEGDVIPVFSKSDGGIWLKEPSVTVIKDPVSGRLKTDLQVTHLSVWAEVFSQPMRDQPLTINYISTEKEYKTIYVRVVASEGSQQLIQEKTVSIKDGDKIQIDVPSGIDVVVKAYEGSSASAPLITSTFVGASSSSVSITNNRTNSNPSLYFNLETVCLNGTFRYTGPIDYKLSTDGVWEAFTPSTNGTLTTKLLEWNKTYDFRIIYKGTEFRRSRTVSQAEFTQSGANWNFSKQTFFNAPTSCTQ
jgi:hypothetical protein